MYSAHRVSPGHRGRPRQSSAAPDMARRAQLREAQRAYRSRQQSLLTSLKSRVVILEDAFGQLSQTMNSFDAQVIKPGAQMSHHQLLQAVKILQTEISSRLRRTSCHASSKEGDCNSTTPNQKPQQTASDTQSPVPDGDDESTTNTSTWTKERAYSSQFWRLFLGSSNGFLPPVKPADHEASPSIRMTSIERNNHTIIYTTTSFAQRLYRTCAEAGYRYLMTDTMTDEETWPQFGLVLQCVSREQTILYFERVLQMRPCNPIYDRRFPFMSLGGAGTHFSPPIQGSQSRNLLLFHESNGVWELPSDEQWFDVRDIEGFLVEHRIRVCGDYQPSALPTNSDLSMRHQSFLQTANIVGSFDLSISSQAIPSNMVMVLNENAVIDRLSRRCVCLGCVPGFRRSEVENLIWQNYQIAAAVAPSPTPMNPTIKPANAVNGETLEMPTR
ncbi:hypothetical protein BBP40_006452 [Aspergillus hancockii]|nr:hypothetical protein BBP40_006452 [Aspergillus hancockii]